MTTENLSSDSWLSGPEADRYLGICHQTRWRWTRMGLLPEPARISPTAVRYKKSWLDTAMEKMRKPEVAA